MGFVWELVVKLLVSEHASGEVTYECVGGRES